MSHFTKHLILMLTAMWLIPSIAMAAPKQGDTLVEPMTKMSFVYIEPGKFMMGSPESEADR